MAHGPDPEEIKRANEAVLSQDANADAFANKVMLLGAAVLAGALVLSWLAIKVHAIETFVHFLGGKAH